MTLLILHRKCSCIWILTYWVNLHILFSYDSDNSFYNHGYINKIVLIGLTIILLILYFLLRGIIFLWRKGLKGILVLVAIVILAGLWYLSRIYNSWDGWEYGLGSTKIDNDNDECKILKPAYWELSIREGLLDFNRFVPSCDSKKMTVNKDLWTSELRETKELKKIGVARAERYENKYKCKQEEYMQKVQMDLVNMDTATQQQKDEIEITIDVSNPDEHFIEMNVKRNETLVQELKEIRRKVLEEDEIKGVKRVDHDVLILYFDNLSRAHFHRKMKK